MRRFAPYTATQHEIGDLSGDTGTAWRYVFYGTSLNDAAAKVKSLALRAIANRLDEGEMAASPITIETVERAQACR